MICVTKTLCMVYPLRRAVFGCLIQPINTMRALRCAAFHLSAAVRTDHSRTFLLLRGDAGIASYCSGRALPDRNSTARAIGRGFLAVRGREGSETAARPRAARWFRI